MSTPLIPALTAILKWKHGPDSVVPPEALFEVRENGRHVVVNYLECIDTLWNQIGSIPKGAPKRDLIAVWAPTEPLNRFDRYLTLYDWVVALVQNAPADSPPPLRVFVIDLAPDPQTHGERMAGILAEHLPWFRVFRPCSRAPELIHLVSQDNNLRQAAAKLLANYLDLEQLLSALGISDIRVSLDRWCPLSYSTRDLLRNLWVNEITRPEGRHGISNLIAPIVLKRALSPAATTPLTADTAHARLEIFLDALRILPKPSQRAWRPLQEEQFVEDNVLGSFGTQGTPRVRFLLVDDHGNHYKDVLKQVLSPFSMEIETNPEPLIRWLEHLGPSCFDAGQLNVMGHPLEGTELASFDVLLLDLRLFDTESSIGKAAERSLLKRLVDICPAQGVGHGHTELVNSLISSTKNMLGLEKSERSDQPSIDHLALLPVLLALADPSLPIVLFSSTRQRDVIDKFSAFPNIITTFAKPVVTGYDVQPTDHAGRLRSALVQALRLHENRVVWCRISNLPSNGTPAPTLVWARGTVGSKRPSDIPAVDFAKEGEYAYFNLETIDGSFQSKSSQITGWKAVRRTLRSYFERYILRGNYHDFASLPFDFLEVACAPPQKKTSQGPFWQNAQIEIKPGFPIDLRRFNDKQKHQRAKLELLRRNDNGTFLLTAPRNTLAHGLQQIRHRKSHGYGPTPSTLQSIADAETFRVPSLLQLSTVIDFLRGERRPSAKSLDWRSVCQAITTSSKIPVGTSRPDQITTSPHVAWDDFVLLCLTWAYAEAPEYFSDVTCDALFSQMKTKWFRGTYLPVGSIATPAPVTEALVPGKYAKASSEVTLDDTGMTHRVGEEHFAKAWSDGAKVLVWLKGGEPWHVEFISN